MIDSKLARILSDFCLDIAKAYFISAFVTAPINSSSLSLTILALLKGLIAAILFIVLSRQFLEFEKE